MPQLIIDNSTSPLKKEPLIDFLLFLFFYYVLFQKDIPMSFLADFYHSNCKEVEKMLARVYVMDFIFFT